MKNKYLITSVKHKDLGKVGDIIEIDNINDIPYRASLRLVEEQEIKIKKVKKNIKVIQEVTTSL